MHKLEPKEPMNVPADPLLEVLGKDFARRDRQMSLLVD